MFHDLVILVCNIWFRLIGLSKREREKRIAKIQDNSFKNTVLKFFRLNKEIKGHPFLNTLRYWIDFCFDVFGFILFAGLFFVCYVHCTSGKNPTYENMSRTDSVSHYRSIVIDSVRHYYPILEGEQVFIICGLKNTLDRPLVVKEALPSDFSVSLTSSMPIVIPKNDTAMVSFTFVADRNIGKTTHLIRFYDEDSRVLDSLIFDTHVVRPSLDGSDHEEHFLNEDQSFIEEFVDGSLGQKGYWTDNQSIHDATPEDSAYMAVYYSGISDSAFVAAMQRPYSQGPSGMPIDSIDFSGHSDLWQRITDFFNPLFHPIESLLNLK